MKVVFLIATCLIACLLFNYIADTKEATSVIGNNPECGPLSLMVICQIYGIKADIKELRKLCNLQENGTTLFDLQKAAQAKGFIAKGLQLDIKTLKKLDTPVIAFVKGKHFLVVNGFQNQRFNIINLPGASFSLPPKELSQIWNGEVLMVERPESSSAGHPHIKVDSYRYDFGISYRKANLSHTFHIKNTGQATLRILDTKSNCVCIPVLLSGKNIPPGGSGELKVDFVTGHSKGRIDYTIALQTNVPDREFVYLTISSVIEGRIDVAPNPLQIGDIMSGQILQRTVTIGGAGHGRLAIKKLVPSSDRISAKIISKNVTEEGRIKLKLLITIKIPEKLGNLDESIIVHTNDVRQPKLQILIKGKVVGDLLVFPKEFFFGFVHNGENISREITISARSGANIKILNVTSDSEFVTVQVAPQDSGKHLIKAKFEPKGFKGTFKSSIVVRTTSRKQPSISIPIYALVGN